MIRSLQPRFVAGATIGLALLAVSASFAAACGGDDDKAKATQAPTTAPAASAAAASPNAAASPSAAAATAQALQLTAVEDGDKYTFSPATFTVKAGAVAVHYTNKAGNARQHGFELKTLDGSGDVFKSTLVDSGSTGDFTFTVPGPGTYQFLCFQRGHADRGQTGTIVVTAN